MFKILDLGIRVWNLVCSENSGEMSLQSGATCGGIGIKDPICFNSCSHNSFSGDNVITAPRYSFIQAWFSELNVERVASFHLVS